MVKARHVVRALRLFIDPSRLSLRGRRHLCLAREVKAADGGVLPDIGVHEGKLGIGRLHLGMDAAAACAA